MEWIENWKVVWGWVELGELISLGAVFLLSIS